LIGNRG